MNAIRSNWTPEELIHSSFACNPVDKASQTDVDSWMLLLRAIKAPAGDALNDPVSGLGQTDQRAAGIALARILAALRISSAEHVARDLVIVPVLLVTQVGADYWDVDLVQ